MEHVDLIDRILPKPQHTIVVETPEELLLIDTSRIPRSGDTVLLSDDRVCRYEPDQATVGVAYCSIRLLK